MKFKDVEGGVSVCCGLCYCSKRTRCIACTLALTPVVVIVVLLIAVLINAAVITDPYVRMSLTDQEPTFMSLADNEWRDKAEKLASAIAIRTISYAPGNMSTDALVELNMFLNESFPTIHSSDFITFEQINGLSRLYRVEGEQPTLNPYVVTGHLDVVPEGDLEEWTYDPFEAGIVTEDGQDFVFGRGTIDDKHSVFGILEALEYKLVNNERPQRTFYIGFGHDEEISGNEGAKLIVERIKQLEAENGEKIDFVMDEGMFVVEDVLPGIEDPLIYIAVTEKGYATVDLKASGEQGHSSVPQKESAIAVLADAIQRLENKPQPNMFGTGPEIDTINYAAPHANYLFRIVLGNMWLFSDLLSSVLATDETTDTIQRTTTAFTWLQSGIKDNVVPGEAIGTINHRIHPSNTIKEVVERDRQTINDDRIEISVRNDAFEATIVSPYDNDAVIFQTIAVSALEVFPTGHIVPGTMVANTDCVHYKELSVNVYRFNPVHLFLDDIARFHGIDERLSIEGYKNVIQFYYRFFTNADYSLVEKQIGDTSATQKEFSDDMKSSVELNETGLYGAAEEEVLEVENENETEERVADDNAHGAAVGDAVASGESEKVAEPEDNERTIEAKEEDANEESEDQSNEQVEAEESCEDPTQCSD